MNFQFEIKVSVVDGGRPNSAI